VTFIFHPIKAVDVYLITSWRYEPPYDIYNLAPPDEESVRIFLDTQNAYYSITDEHGDLVAFCCFGAEGQVPGGDYSVEALDIGMGMRPDLTGQGRGLTYVKAVLDFARRTFDPTAFRVTVAKFNKRALRVWQKAGFRPVQTFQRSQDGLDFVILLRKV
jgi:RimJ/RimL family protein N-acetyltransferase